MTRGLLDDTVNSARQQPDHWAEYHDHVRHAVSGNVQTAEDGLSKLLEATSDRRLAAQIQNDLGVIASTTSRVAEAKQRFESAEHLAPGWSVPNLNLRRLLAGCGSRYPEAPLSAVRQTRVAIVSLLFNWPSTGGGTVHTAETGKFLTQAGYFVRHFYAEFDDWGLGKVSDEPLSPSEALRFNVDEWTLSGIKSRFKNAMRSFRPDWVIVTDSWNSKAILAEAVEDYPYFLRIAAQECLCPLNNVRLLHDGIRFYSCPRHQLATPAECCKCVYANGKYSGALHKAEREFVNYGSTQYDASLRSAFARAEAVLVVNPLIGAMVSPYAKRVCVIPSGFDPARFPSVHDEPALDSRRRLQILFAGLVNEPMKGFAVVRDACHRLWGRRQDFELVATGDPIGNVDPYMRFVGWQSQSALPLLLREADILVFPTVAEEALGRTAVEAMAVGRPVVASRIGGLQFTVADGATGLLFEPGDVVDLSDKLEQLLDDPELRGRLGRAGRERFEEHYTWDAIIDKHYRPLLGESCRSHGPQSCRSGR